jgi:hypothetical protein
MDNPLPVMMRLSKYVLDPGNNGNLNVRTKADAIGEIYQEAVEDIRAFEQNPNSAVIERTTVTSGCKAAHQAAKGDFESSTMPTSLNTKLSSITNSPPKRKIVNNSTGETQQPSPKKKSEKERDTGRWKEVLQKLLDECEKARGRRRCDWKKVNAEEQAWKTAMEVLVCLENRDDCVNDDFLQGVQAEFEHSSEVLRQYLTGDPNGLLSVTKLQELTTKWSGWIEKQIVESTD